MSERIDGMDIIDVEEYFSHNGRNEPDEKKNTLPEAPIFPLDALPEPIANLARVGAKSISCPPDYLAVAGLAAAAGAVGSTRVARIKNSWREPVTLYAALVGPSGDGKTPAEVEATLPINSKQLDLFSEYKKKLKEYEEELRKYEVDRSKARKEDRVPDEPPKKPYLSSVFVQDATSEALVDVLDKNPRGLIRIEDELGGMVQSFDQYKSGGKGRERTMWLQIWSAQTIKVDRKSGDGSIYVPYPCVSLVGNIQPKILPTLLLNGEDKDGFAARILFSYPKSVPVHWTMDDVSEDIRGTYKTLLDTLGGLEHKVDDDDTPLPIEVGFSSEALERFGRYFNKTASEMAEPGFDHRLGYAWAKFRGYTARLALVLALCRSQLEGVDERIELVDVKNAEKLVDYFKAMAKRTYASIFGQRPTDQLAFDVVELLRTLPERRWYGRPEDGFSMIREASNHSPASATEVCKKLDKIATDHPVLWFEHGHESNREKKRFWSLGLKDDGAPEDPQDPDEPETKTLENSVRSVRSVRKVQKRVNFERFSASESGNGHLGIVVPLPVKPKKAPTKKKKRPEVSRDDFLAANEELAKTHNLVYLAERVPETVRWLEGLTDVAVDIETYGSARGAPARKKEALSFVKGKVRLIQLSSGTETYLIDTMFLSKTAVADILEVLRGKALYLHNGIFDIPRLEKHFGVDLADEDIRDTLVLSRLARAGEWVSDKRTKTGMRPYRHDIRSVLLQEKVAEISNETDHRWHEPLNEERLRYAQDDVRHLIEAYPRLMELVEERGLTEGLELFKRVYPVYLRMQSRGVPFDKDLFDEFTEKVESKIEAAWTQVEEHKPEHPEGGTWSWRNYQPINEKDPSTGAGRNGARRALSVAGFELSNMQKHTRLEYLKKHPGEAPLLEALHEYLRYSDLKSDCQSWLKYHHEDSRLYPNVKPFSQETGRSAYADPAIQNIPKGVDEEIGISLRDCIKAPQSMRLVKADYAAQELRILAHVTNDEKLITSFAEGADPHVVVGEQVAGHSLEEGTADYRTYRKLGKRANYGFAYGAGPARYAQSVFEDTAEKISMEQAKAEQAAFQTAWPGVYEWQQGFGDADGADETDWYTLSFVGRRRYVGQKKDRYSGGYKPSYCDRLNAPIQSGGADMLYVALKLLLDDKDAGLFPEVEVLITTHDEIVLEAPDEVEEGARVWLETKMRDAARRFLREELASEDCVEGATGPSWGGK